VTRNEAKAYVIDIMPVAIDGMVNEGTTNEQAKNFASALVRALCELIDSEPPPTARGEHE
jgi:hypothetical protein